MKVAIDTTPLNTGHKYRGVGVYTKSLIKALYQLNDGNEYFVNDDNRLNDADVVHYPFFDLFFLTLPVKKQQKTVVTVHDVIPLVFDKHYPPGMRGKVKCWIQKRRLQQAEAIITDSETSKRDIVNYLDIESNRVNRVYLAGVEELKNIPQKEALPVVEKYGVEGEYFLYVGDINYNKNVSGLIKAYAKISAKAKLVMVSRAMAQKSVEAEEIRSLISSLSLNKRVIILTNVPDEPIADLGALYSMAAAYVQPSFYEGFGLPVLDAMQCGVPVICSTGGSLVEVAGEGALLFEPSNINKLVGLFEQVLKLDGKERRLLIEKGYQQAHRFSWRQTAKETVKVYESIV